MVALGCPCVLHHESIRLAQFGFVELKGAFIKSDAFGKTARLFSSLDDMAAIEMNDNTVTQGDPLQR